MLHELEDPGADDEIWHFGKHEQVELPYLEDTPPLPEPMEERLRFTGGQLTENDLCEAVAYFLYSQYGSAAWDAKAEITVMPVDKSACAQAEGLEATPTKRSSGDGIKATAILESVVSNPSSPAPSPNKRYRCKDPELLQEVSKRMREKQPGPRQVVIKRNAKLCQTEGCIFSTGQPGQPARASTTYCMWCDPEAMRLELETAGGRTKIAKALALFKKHAATHNAALDLLPADFASASLEYCRSSHCVFNERHPGHPAYAKREEGGLCMFCDAALLEKKLATAEGTKSLRIRLTIFKAADGEVYRRAMALMPTWLQSTNHYCQANGCRFNTMRPGHAATCTESSDYCIWHTDSALESALETSEGRKSVRRAMALLRASGATHDGVFLWQQALDLLPPEFGLSARMCANSRCRFSLRHIGEPARAHERSDLCTWCDTEMLAHRESMVQGRRLIAFAMSKWLAHTDVLLEAWRKLSEKFREDFARRASENVERQGMRKNDFLSTPAWVTSVWETEAMERHDFVTYPRRSGNQDSKYAVRPYGFTCELCGETFLWRRRVKWFERAQGAVEDPLSHDRLRMGMRRIPMTLRPGMRCTLCYEARCRHCSQALHLCDYLWNDACVHCGIDGSPYFIQRAIRRPTRIETGLLLLEMGNREQLQRILNKDHAMEGIAYTQYLHFQCSCCGHRPHPASASFQYLTWQPPDSPYVTPPHWGYASSGDYSSRPCRRPGYLCDMCQIGRGHVYQHLNRCPWAESTFAWNWMMGNYYWGCKCRGQPVQWGRSG